MKQIIIVMCIGVFAMANEFDRMESIVIDIKNLRADYARCTKELKSKNTKNNEKSNINLINAVKTKEKNKETKKEKNIENLKNKYEEIIKNRDNEIISLKNKINSINKTRIIKKEICIDDNPFPQLMMKNSKVDSKARTYRLNKESNIYDSVNGNFLYTWENKTSFTSTKMTQNWIAITGYFVDRKWLKAKRSLWLEKVNATAR